MLTHLENDEYLSFSKPSFGNRISIYQWNCNFLEINLETSSMRFVFRQTLSICHWIIPSTRLDFSICISSPKVCLICGFHPVTNIIWSTSGDIVIVIKIISVSKHMQLTHEKITIWLFNFTTVYLISLEASFNSSF